MECVVLFDIDGTLVTGVKRGLATAGVRAMNRASKLVAGKESYFGGVHYAGRTDVQIAGMLLEAAGHANPSRDRVDELVARYVEFLGEEISVSPYRALGSPREAVTQLREAGATVALGTGNVRAGGFIKLESAGIADLFDTDKGGYGEDGETRAELLEKGALSCDPSGSLPVVIVGDTPRDVAAAHEIGALCVGIPYGNNDRAVLEEAGADAIADAVDKALVPVIRRLIEEGGP